MTLTQITEKGIKDGEIINADVNASAAIAGSKISPDFGSQNIVTTGSVGIGIGSQTPSTPQKQLHIAHDSSPRIMLSNDTTGHATPNGTELLLDSGGNFEILQRENLNIEFFTNNSQRMTIDNNGDVGIGTASPFANLQVMDTASNIPQIRIETSDGGNKRLDLKVEDSDGIISCEQSAQELHLKTTNNVTFTTASSERMRIDSAGRLLLGTNTNTFTGVGSSKLQISGTGADTAGANLIRTSNDGGGAYLQFTKNRGSATQSGDTVGAISWMGHDGTDTESYFAQILVKSESNATNNSTKGSIRFGTSNGSSITSERMRLDETGRLLVNTTSGHGKLQLHDGSFVHSKPAGGGTRNWRFVNNNTAVGDYGIQISTTEEGTTYANHTELKRGGNVHIHDGDLVLASGHGIDFSATSQATGSSSELLDDYEEGTWTPNLIRNGLNSPVSLGSGVRYGYYKKVGKIITLAFYWYNPSLTSSSGSYWIIQNMPFSLKTGSGGAYQFIPGGYYYMMGNTVGDSSNNGSYRWQSNSNGLVLYSANNGMDANGAVEFSGCGTLCCA